MKKLTINFYFCGMSEDTFSDQIMIYKPSSSIARSFTEADLHQLKINSIEGLTNHLKSDTDIQGNLGPWGLERLSATSIYIQHQGYLLGLQSDKSISDVFLDFELTQLELAYFLVAGASIHNETSYRFTIHPDEKIHKHTPHVHVAKAGVEIRYSLESLLPIDSLVNPHKRDNKKVITPFLRKNQSELLALWNYYTKGYTVPEITQNGEQFYSES